MSEESISLPFLLKLDHDDWRKSSGDTNRTLGEASQVAAGAVILLIGLIVLARFLQRYPRTQAPSGLGVSHGRR